MSITKKNEHFSVDLPSETKEKLTEIIERFATENGYGDGCLIAVLHETQEILGHIPYEAQCFIAEKLNVPLAEVYGVVTFYSRFTLTPTGRYKVGICMGTACYVKGSEKILDEAQKFLGIKACETSSNGKFSIEANRCIGACSLAPVMTINGDVYAKLSPGEVAGILTKYQ